MQEQLTQPESPQRPQLLTILCILSFIGSGLAASSYFLMYASYNELMPLLEDMIEQFPAMELFLTINRNFFLTGFILYVLSLAGINLMWRRRKAGFHFYTGSQIMILLMPLFYIDGFPIPYLDGAFTALFIFMYFRFYPSFT